MCECVVEHRSNHSDNTEEKESWLRIASEHIFQSVEDLKNFAETKCLLHTNQQCILKRINELKTSKKFFNEVGDR